MTSKIFHKIMLTDRRYINDIRTRFGQTLSTYSFTVLFSWKAELSLFICTEKDFFIIQYENAGPDNFFFPCGDREKTRAFIGELLDEGRPFCLHFLSPGDKYFVEREFGDKLKITADRASFDYIGSVEGLSQLKGKEYRHIRKEVNAYKREKPLLAEPITEKNIEIARNLTLQWHNMPVRIKGWEYSDTGPALMALARFRELGLTGLLFSDGSDYTGYILGSELSSDTFCIHFAKCLDKTRGADYYSKHIFCRELPGRYIYFNMEEDMGLPGIRQRKNLLNPVAMSPVYKCEPEEKP